MHITHKEKDGVTICHITGEINIDTVSELKETFKKLLDNKSPKILLNLSAVEYIDSLGTSTLIMLLKRLKSAKGSLSLSDVPPKIMSVFSITRCDKVFKICATEKEALKALS